MRQTPTHADDGIFPPAAVAKPFIDFDGKGFLINGQRTFLVSGGLEYARIPRALWRDRLLRVKRAGFNTVEIYLFWNYHEPKEGQWDFSDNRDIDAFLKLCKSLDLYVTVRVGPYVCAEWDFGGFPVWLRFKPNLAVREVNAEFQKYVDLYLDRVIPIVAANQIDRGGSVVLVQLENEHPQGWGKEMPNAYFTHLRDKALALGIEVPYFFSGLHHSSDPAGGKAWDSIGRTNPWYSTEFWCDWYDVYGNPTPDATRKEDRATWKILAYGGNGYNYYMIHGGTNFDHFNNNEDASSYDYGAAVGQAGDIRPIYYKFKRAAMFATSFASVLENSTNTSAQYQTAATNPVVKVTARTSPAGTILFLDNPTDAAVETQVKLAEGESLPKAGALRLEPGEIMPIVINYAITPTVTLDRGIARVLGTVKQGDLTTIVIYGQPGTAGSLTFRSGGASSDYVPKFTSGERSVQNLTIGGQKIRVIAETSDDADQTFFANLKGNPFVVAGFPYVGDLSDSSDGLHVATESVEAVRSLAIAPPTIYGEDTAPFAARMKPTFRVPPTGLPTLSAWETKSVAGEALPGFDDKFWTASDAPKQMGADGDDGAFAWYRTKVHVDAAGSYSMVTNTLRDRALAYVDGKSVPASAVHGNTITMDLTPGDHSVAIFVAHYGRDKIFGHLGAIDTIDAKGITGPVYLRQTASGGAAAVTGWQYQMTDRRRSTTIPAPTAAGWKPATIGQDVFNKTRGYAFYQTTLPALPAAAATGAAAIHFAGVDDNATIFLNGKRIGQHKGWSDAFDVPISAADLKPGGQPNTLTVLVENTDNTGGLSGPVSVTTYSYNAEIYGWKMRGGTSDPLVSDGFQPVAPDATLSGPRLFRATFSAAAPSATGQHQILRATFAGLSHGFMYLNGHNLGRYPEKVPIDGIYLPEPYLNGDKNTLVILDEDGNTPTGVKLVTEAAASRTAHEFIVRPATK